ARASILGHALDRHHVRRAASSSWSAPCIRSSPSAMAFAAAKRTPRPLARPSILAVLVLFLLPFPARGLAKARNPKWTTLIPMAGVPGLARVSPELYRAGQLTNEGVENLARAPFRIRTVVSLRLLHGDLRRLSPGLLTRYGMHYDRIRELAGFPRESEMVQ